MEDRPAEPTGASSDIAEVTDVLALTALANLDRARLLDVLAVYGPSSTSVLARRLELATGSVSHHLRVLARAGLVEPAPEAAADQRASSWKLVTRGRRWSRRGEDASPAAEMAARAAEGVVLERQFQRAREWQAIDEMSAWDEAASSVNSWMHLSPAEMQRFGAQVEELIVSWRRRARPAEDLDDDAAERRPVLAFFHAFPSEP